MIHSKLSILLAICFHLYFADIVGESCENLHEWILMLKKTLLQENMYKLYCVPTVNSLSWKSFNYDPKKARLICGSYIENSSFQTQQNFLSYSNILASNVQNFSFLYKTLIAQKVCVPSFASMYFQTKTTSPTTKKAFPQVKFPLFPKSNEKQHSRKNLATILEFWKIDVFF